MPGSEARCRKEVMPGKTSGEVMRRKASAEVMPPSVGRNALKSISGRKAFFAGKPLRSTASIRRPPKIRCTLKNEDSLSAAQNNVTRQRSAVPAEKTGSSFRRYASRLFVLGTRSRIKSGMTTDGYSEKARFRHSDKAPGRNLDTIASRFSPANGELFNFEPA